MGLVVVAFIFALVLALLVAVDFVLFMDVVFGNGIVTFVVIVCCLVVFWARYVGRRHCGPLFVGGGCLFCLKAWPCRIPIIFQCDKTTAL